VLIIERARLSEPKLRYDLTHPFFVEIFLLTGHMNRHNA
jgi:hypothetical protein